MRLERAALGRPQQLVPRSADARRDEEDRQCRYAAVGRIREYRNTGNVKQLWVATIQKDPTTQVDQVKLVNTSNATDIQLVTPTSDVAAKFNPYLFDDPVTGTSNVVIRANDAAATSARIEGWREMPWTREDPADRERLWRLCAKLAGVA